MNDFPQINSSLNWVGMSSMGATNPKIPKEVLAFIFDFLPMQKVIGTCRLVSREWRASYPEETIRLRARLSIAFMKTESFLHSSKEVGFTLNYLLLIKDFEKVASLFKEVEESFSNNMRCDRDLFLSLLKFAAENDCFSLILWMRSTPVYLQYLKENEGKVYSIFIKNVKPNLELVKSYLPTLSGSEKKAFFNYLQNMHQMSFKTVYFDPEYTIDNSWNYRFSLMYRLDSLKKIPPQTQDISTSLFSFISEHYPDHEELLKEWVHSTGLPSL